MYRTVVTTCTAQWSLHVPHSGHYMYRPVVTTCTASLTFTNSTFCPHTVFMCFVWIWEQTAIISLYNINWLVCITERESVYCAVRTGSLNVIQVQLIRHCPMLISMDASLSRRTNLLSQVTNQNAMIVPKTKSALQTSTSTFLLVFKRLTCTVSYHIIYFPSVNPYRITKSIWIW